MKELTAVQFLETIIKHCERFGTNVEQKDIEEALVKEREQIRSAYIDGQDDILELCKCKIQQHLNSLHYYQKKFK